MPDNPQNPSSNAQPEPASPAAPTSSEPKPKKNTLLIVVIVILVVLLLCMGVLVVLMLMGVGSFMAYQTDVDDTTETEEQEDEDTDVDEQDSSSTTQDYSFSGQAIEATYPSDWLIEEYLNGNGTDMLVSGVTYSGLTGLKIYAPGNKLVFEMKALYGIGGTDACSEYYKFSDNSSTYQADVVSRSLSGGVTTSIVDLSSSTYTSFNFLGKRVRRISKTYYYDVDPSDTSTFDAACGIDHSAWAFDDLKFIADGMDASAYQLEIVDSPTNAELQELDSILDSIFAI